MSWLSLVPAYYADRVLSRRPPIMPDRTLV